MDESRSAHRALPSLAALRRKWHIIVPFTVVTPLVAYVLATALPGTYASSADVLIDRNGRALSGLLEATAWDEMRRVRTEAELARLGDIDYRSRVAVEKRGTDLSESNVSTWVTEDGSSNVLTFHAQATDPAIATTVATAYAAEYVAERRARETTSLGRAIAVVETELARVRAGGSGSPSVYADLVRQEQQLNVGLATLESNARLVGAAVTADRVGLDPVMQALAALVLGLITGLGLAVLTLVLDTRSSSVDEIGTELGLPILARVPLERRRGTSSLSPAVLSSRHSRRADAIRTLRTNLELELHGRHQGVVLVTSAADGEGKSTTVADLGVALAVAGRKVALVDLDLRRPSLGRLFDLTRSPGIADAARGMASLGDATHRVVLHAEDGAVRAQESDPSLLVVPAGNTLAADVHEVLTGAGLESVLGSLRESTDIVLIDGPRLLLAGDALTLSAQVDALLLVTRMTRYRRRYGPEIRHFLARSPAEALGIVAVGKPTEIGSRRDVKGAPRRVRARFHALGRA